MSPDEKGPDPNGPAQSLPTLNPNGTSRAAGSNEDSGQSPNCEPATKEPNES